MAWSSNGFLGGVIGRGLKCACGIVNRLGGEDSVLLLLLLALLLSATVTGMAVEPAGSAALLGWSELLDLKRAGLFFGLSTADFDLGRPTFGNDGSVTAPTTAFFMAGMTPS